MKIKTRLYISLAVNIGLLILLVFMLIVHSSEISRELEKQKIAQSLVRHTTDLIMVGEEFLVYHYPRTLEQWELKTKLIKGLTKKNKTPGRTYNISRNLEILDNSFSRIRNMHLEFSEKPVPEELVLLEERLSGQVRVVSRDMISNAMKLSETVASRVYAIQQKSNLAILIISFFIITITAITSHRIFNRITASLSGLVRDAKIIKDGNLKHQIAGIEGPKTAMDDEIGELSMSFSSMTGDLIKAIENLKVEVSERKKTEIELQKAHNSLEHQVDDRTVELRKSNEQLHEEIKERKFTEKELQQRTLDLNERVKELNCLYGISNLVETPDITLEEILQGVVNLIPRSWKYPQITCSRIILEDQEYKTANFSETAWKLSSDVFVRGEKAGTLEVYYLEKKTELSEGPFLKEERSLINAVTERLGYIIERRQTEAELRHERKRLHLLLENFPGYIYLQAQDYSIRYANHYFIERFGEPTDKLCHEVLWGSKEPCKICKTFEVFDTKKPIVWEWDRAPDARTYSVYDFPFIDSDGSELVLEIGMDITKIKDLEKKLNQARKMEAIGTLAGGVAHNFNNVLYSIVGYTELVMEDVPEGSLAHSNLNQVFKGAMRAKDMVRQILAFSRKADTKKKPIKVQSVVNKAVKLLRTSIPSTIEIRPNIDVDCRPVLADSTQLHQVVVNLATNAYQAMRDKGGVLELTLAEEEIGPDDSVPDLGPGIYLNLTVRDTGHGMDNVVMGKIFEPYFTTRGVGEGTGMGLAMVHGIVKDHGGDITVFSEPGEGTMFHVYFPLIGTRHVERKPILSGPAPTGKERILFVDDEEPIVFMTQQGLERLGYKVTSRTSSVDALEAFRAGPDAYDLVVTDMTMPNLTGIELAARLKEIRPDIPIIICTGFSEMIDEGKAKTAGISEYVMKPIVREELAGTIRKVLDGWTQGRY